MPCSHVFVKQLDLTQKYKLEFTSWRRVCQKLESV
jgi:hypothetical protein